MEASGNRLLIGGDSVSAMNCARLTLIVGTGLHFRDEWHIFGDKRETEEIANELPTVRGASG